MKEKIASIRRNSPRLFFLIIALIACCLLGAGTLIASQYYGNVAENDEKMMYADTMAAGYNQDVVDSLTYQADKSVYMNNNSTKFDSSARFKLLEIVPYKGMGEFGYMVAGEEPINLTAFWKYALELEPNKEQRNSNILKNSSDADIKKFINFLGFSDGTGALAVDNEGNFYNTQAFLKNVLAEAYFGEGDKNLQKAIDYFAKVDGNHISNRIDVLTVDPMTLNAHPELIDDATLLYIHGMGDASREESAIIMKMYENEKFNPAVRLAKESDSIKTDESIYYLDWIATNVTHGNVAEAAKKVDQYVNFEYRIGVENGKYVVKQNDLSLNVINKIYTKVMDKEVAIAIEPDVLGIQSNTTSQVNKIKCSENKSVMVGSATHQVSQLTTLDGKFEYLYNNNMYKLLTILTMGSESFYEANGKSMPTQSVTFFHPILNVNDGYTLATPILEEDKEKTGDSVKLSNADQLPKEYTTDDYSWKNQSTWVAKTEWLTATKHTLFWSLGNLWNCDDNNSKGSGDYGKQSRSHFKNLLTSADNDYLFDSREDAKSNILILSKWDPTKRTFYKIANDKEPATPDFQTILKAIMSHNKIRILEVEPYDSFYYGGKKQVSDIQDTDRVSGLNFYLDMFPWLKKKTVTTRNLASYAERITVDTMPIYEFIGNIEDINSEYDVIFFGTRTKDLHGELKNTINNSSLYSAVGTTVLKNPNDISTLKNVHFSGNDLSDKKYKEVVDFLNGGKIVIFDAGTTDSMEVYQGDGSVNTKTFSSNSNLKKLAELRSDEKYKNQIFVRGVDTGTTGGLLYEQLENPLCNLVITRKDDPEYYPTVYGGDPTKDTYNKNSKGELSICFKIEGVPSDSKLHSTEAASKYKAYLYMDANADGHYVGSVKSKDVEGINELIRGCYIWDMDTNERLGVCGSVELEAGKEYRIQKKIKDNSEYVGIIPWKLEVYNIANKSMRACEVNYTVVQCTKPEHKKRIDVLQITDVGVGPKGTSLNMATNKTFKTKLENVKEYNVTVTDFATLKGKKYEIRSGSLKGKERNVPKIKDENYSAKKWKQFFDNYDMLIFGFVDEQRITLDDRFNQALTWYIQDGKAVIFSHDQVIDYELIKSKNCDQLGSYISALRYLCGMDVYGIVKDEYGNIDLDKLYDMNGVKLYTESNGKYYDKNNNEVKSDTLNLTQKCAMYKGVLVQVGAQYVDKPSGSQKTIGENNNLTLTTYINNGNKYYDRNGAPDRRPPGSNNVTSVRITNRGQITNYPYYIPDNITVAPTHTQYFQLDMEEENMAVWSCLSSNLYDMRRNDSANSYYILNKGNITYTGLGHNGSVTEKEVELFVNTMISAYRSTPRAPYAIIANKEATKSLTNDNTNTINVMGEVDETATEDIFSGDKVRVKFYVSTGDKISRADNSDVFCGIIDEVGNKYEIHEMPTGGSENGNKLMSNSLKTGEGLIFGVDESVTDEGEESVDFEGLKVKRREDLSDETPDYYVDIPMDKINEQGMVTLDIQCYLEYQDASATKHVELEHVYVEVIPNMLFMLE